MIKLKNNFFIPAIVINFVINLIFLKNTFDNPWLSDDYPYIFGSKLFNLINGNLFYTFQFIGDDTRFIPFFWFIVQFIPENFQFWHSIIVLFYFFSSVFIFLISNKITNNSQISILASILFTINYSISIKSLSWNIFFGHIFNSTLGFLAILIFLTYYEKNKKILLIFYFIFSFLGCLISESGLIFPILAFLILFFFKKERSKKNLFISLSPIFAYLVIVFIYTGKFLPILQDRISSERSATYSKILNIKDDESLYFYRSTYAPRDLKGYSIRIIDNIIGSLNQSAYEKVLKFYDSDNHLKKYIKEKFLLIIFSFILLLSIFIFFILKKFTKSQRLGLYNLIFLFISILLIYSVIYFRKDINIALSFVSALLISYVINCLIKNKFFLTSVIILIIFFTPSVMFSITKFEYFGDFKPRSTNIVHFNELKNLSSNQNVSITKRNNDFKYYYYYKNFKIYENSLAKYRGYNLNEFVTIFDKDNSKND